MKKDVYVYLLIFSYVDDGIFIEFFDLLGCLFCVDMIEEVVVNVKEVMGLYLFGMEEDNDLIFELILVISIKFEFN